MAPLPHVFDQWLPGFWFQLQRDSVAHDLELEVLGSEWGWEVFPSIPGSGLAQFLLSRRKSSTWRLSWTWWSSYVGCCRDLPSRACHQHLGTTTLQMLPKFFACILHACYSTTTCNVLLNWSDSKLGQHRADSLPNLSKAHKYFLKVGGIEWPLLMIIRNNWYQPLVS